MRTLYLDCFSGVSGDMMVGALCDLGVAPSVLEWELTKIEIGDFHMHFERQSRQHVEGVKFGIHEGATHRHEEEARPREHGEGCDHADHDHNAHEHHHHDHEEGHHGHSHEHPAGRSHADIKKLIEESALSDFVKKRALAIFQRIAVAEGKIHGMPPSDVHFHEVGALDSIADIVCACVGIEHLGVEQVVVSHLQEGSGWVDCAHGRFPVPSFATLEILAGIPLRQTGEADELITPTGAAIVAEFGASFGTMPQLKVARVGYGVGARELAGRPNVLRAVLGDTCEGDKSEADTVTRIETNLDDLSPEIIGSVFDKLLAMGALDVFLTPVQMKKNRPGVQLTVLCDDALVERATDLIFRETSSFGVRIGNLRRIKLERRSETVATPYGDISVKLGMKAGKVLQIAPEFESCRLASEKAGQPLRTVYEVAQSAARDSFGK